MFPTAHARKIIEMHFRHRDLVWSEDYFVAVLRTSDKKGDLCCACAGLREVGTTGAVAAIKLHVSHRIPDVRRSAFETVVHLLGAADTPWYGEMLLSGQAPVQQLAFATLCSIGDERGFDALQQHLAHLLAGKGGLPVGTIAFMQRYLQHHPDIRAVAPNVVNALDEQWSRLSPDEQRRATWLAQLYRPS